MRRVCLRGLAVLLGSAIALSASSCGAPRPVLVDFSDASRTYRASDYPAALDRWTRRAKLVQDVGTVMEVWATLMSWDFRQAYIAKFAKVYDLTEGEREAIVKSQREAANVVYEIHLVAQSTSYSWNDLEKKSSPWRLTLLDGTGAEIAPSSVKVERLPEIYESEFFPMRTPYSKTYKVRFVKPDGAGDAFVGPSSGRLILRVASPMGKVETVWEARDAGRGQS